ncbi:DUF6894 family protein [Glacieibacterium frigidum]|uniref:DUF6894 family protein n=1 Tax=Glacieibacterium frigidum TaxID=2593303 RepID=UPI0038B255BD
MPRYFLHLHNDIDARDEEGIELQDLKAARSHTVDQAASLIGETIKETRRLVLSHRIDIEDCDGKILSTVPFSDVITIVS